LSEEQKRYKENLHAQASGVGHAIDAEISSQQNEPNSTLQKSIIQGEVDVIFFAFKVC
jgi:hypothetical protein